MANSNDVMQSKVSIILPLYNSAAYIKSCIESIRKQTYKNWELLIVDDCSTDNPEIIISQYLETDPRISLYQLETNGGAGIARNKGIEMSSGDYIAFLDSDDQWVNDKLEKQISFMNDLNADLSFTDYYIVQASGEEKLFRNSKTRISLSDEIRFNYLACSTVIYNVKKLGKEFMPHYRNRQDWGLWINLLKKTDYAYCLREPLTFYVQRGNSISSNKFKMIGFHWLIYNEHLGYNSVKSLWYLTNNIIMHLYYGVKKSR